MRPCVHCFQNAFSCMCAYKITKWNTLETSKWNTPLWLVTIGKKNACLADFLFEFCGANQTCGIVNHSWYSTWSRQSFYDGKVMVRLLAEQLIHQLKLLVYHICTTPKLREVISRCHSFWSHGQQRTVTPFLMQTWFIYILKKCTPVYQKKMKNVKEPIKNQSWRSI